MSTKDGQNIRLVQPYQKKTEKYINRLLTKKVDAKYKMEVRAAEGRMCQVEWSVNVLLNSLKIATEMILIAKTR